MTEIDQPTEEYNVEAGFAAEDAETAPKPKRKRKAAKPALPPVLHVNWFSTRHNARHPDVKVWQLQMQERGHELEADGVFGFRSEAAARELQGELPDCAEDGIVGTETWDATWAA